MSFLITILFVIKICGPYVIIDLFFGEYPRIAYIKPFFNSFFINFYNITTQSIIDLFFL